MKHVCLIWPKRAARTNVIAVLYCLPVILLELIQ